ncbi:tyrosine-type recombinase/integrase [uncultured Thomasclavelia sp.]|uniref:tyrosine-type recombinase/integrase n=1 Tax=uncultured Thomasclavelia sp. TaxID=3025759 RepID=UPI0035A65C9C
MSFNKKGTDYESISVHFLRHANATLLLMNDVDLKIVSAHLGRSDINITADTYTDVLHARQKFVADLVDLNLEDENDK